MPRLKGYGKAPYIDLREAQHIVEKIAREGAGKVTHEHLAIMLKHSAGSSAFLNKIIALKRYGLVEKSGRNAYQLTHLGYELAEGPNPTDALFRAFLNEPLLRDIHERYKGKLLLSKEALKNILEKEFEVGSKYSEDWVDLFLRNLEEANLVTRAGGTTMILSNPEQPRPVEKAVDIATYRVARELAAQEVEPSIKPKLYFTYTLQDGGEIQIRILEGIEKGEWETLEQMLKPLIIKDEEKKSKMKPSSAEPKEEDKKRRWRE